MFGEDDTDSLRAPSPWDSFLSSSPEPASLEKSQHLRQSVPKLVPEVEEVRLALLNVFMSMYLIVPFAQGNVEYKLKLTDISPARFARLVTQLKWRLLEGSGQAYYELGVADSGALIGLSRSDLEQSLETLEMMAGEIGASVIVVKEIEVPPAMVALADKVSDYIDPETGEWTNKMVNKRSRGLPYWDLDADTTDASSTDIEEPSSDIHTPADLLDASVILKSGRVLPSNPERPTAQSSPFITALDDDLALFSMEPEPAFTIDSGDEPLLEVIPEPLSLTDTGSSLNIGIASVYKPRPIRRRPSPSSPGSGALGRKAMKIKGREKKAQPWHQSPPKATPVADEVLPVPNKQEIKALQRRLARDKRREEKRKGLVGLAESGAVIADNSPTTETEDKTGLVLVSEDETAELVIGLDELAVSAGARQVVAPEIKSEPLLAALDIAEPAIPTAPLVAAEDTEASVFPISKDPRLIVEALVVRKMSIEEAFLNFSSFSLT
ncbi:hypothetical protein EIP86_011402 [Pleurotus ostreatoroseus]|nr:hypothetical protein EIP86_011402 [Pleurotus ostreatoroseus]